jgi:hypothetical protein
MATPDLGGQGRQQTRRGGRGRAGAGLRSQGQGKWSMPGFSVDPGSAVQVAGQYSVKAVQTQVTLQGTHYNSTGIYLSNEDLVQGTSDIPKISKYG